MLIGYAVMIAAGIAAAGFALQAAMNMAYSKIRLAHGFDNLRKAMIEWNRNHRAGSNSDGARDESH